MRHTLEVDSIILEFGTKRILQDVYLKSETGKITGILGRNGSGKTSLMNIIYGELDTNGKSVRLNGNAIINGFRDPSDFRYLPQFNFIPKNLKVESVFKDFEIAFSKFIHYFPGFKKYEAVKMHSLSSGERRIIEIYTILASQSKFCMLDEPFSHVMPVHLETLKAIIKREKEHKGILITDHAYTHVTDICDELYVIANGKTYLTRDNNDLKTLGYLSK